MVRNVATVKIGAGVEWLTDGVALGRASLSPGEGAGRHTHALHVVTVLLSSPGASAWRFGDARYDGGRLAAGDVFVCPAGVEASVRCERPFESVSVVLTPAGLDRIAGTAPASLAGGIRPEVERDDTFVRHVVLALAEETSRVRAGRERVADALTTALGVHLLREYAGAVGGGRAAGLTGGDLGRLRRHIDRNLDSDLSLDRLAAVVHKSRFHFARLFKSATGLTPHQYVVRRRVARARELLRAGGIIVEVAAAVGFASQSHSGTHHVRRAFGCTPGELVGRLSRGT